MVSLSHSLFALVRLVLEELFLAETFDFEGVRLDAFPASKAATVFSSVTYYTHLFMSYLLLEMGVLIKRSGG